MIIVVDGGKWWLYSCWRNKVVVGIVRAEIEEVRAVVVKIMWCLE